MNTGGSGSRALVYGGAMTGVNLKNLDLNLLVVFEAIYSTGNISHAAEQLAMSQPAVSNALARLRDLLDDRLFVRARRGVEPTSKAKAIIGPLREALGLIKHQLSGEDALDLATYQRQFRILMFDPLEPILMPPVLQRIIHEAPGISIECRPPYPIDFEHELLAGTLDLACYIYPLNAPDVVTVPLCPVDVVTIARRGHPKVGKTLDLETFKALKHVTLLPELRALTHVEKDIAASSMQRDVAYMVARCWSMPAIVERTDLIASLPRWFAEEMAKNFDIQIHKPPIPIAEQHIYMMWHRKNEHDAGHRWLREILVAAMRQHFTMAENVTPFARPAAGRRTNNAGRPISRRSE
jgi:DNA-binding transcriptional LysR family regulator